MSYVDAPATTMLATHCAACGRPLVDAGSVELGIGPDCRRRAGWSKRKGFTGDVTPDWASALLMLLGVYNSEPRIAKALDAEDSHAAANAIVHAIALAQVGGEVPRLVAALHCLGFVRLSEACSQGTGVHVAADGGLLVITAPYNEAFNGACRAVPGARWDRERSARVVPEGSKTALWRAIKATFPTGTVVFGVARVAIV